MLELTLAQSHVFFIEFDFESIKNRWIWSPCKYVHRHLCTYKGLEGEVFDQSIYINEFLMA